MNVLKKYREFPIQAKLAFWLMVASVTTKGVSVITVPIFSRLLTKSEYGYVSTFLSWRNVFLIFTSFNLSAGVYNKGLSKYKNDRNGYCLAMQYTTSFLTVTFYVVYLIAHKYINSFTDMSTLVTSLMFLNLFFSTAQGFWNVKEQYSFRYRGVVVGSIALALADPIISLIFVTHASNDKYIARIIGIVIAQVIIGLFFYVVNIIRAKGKFSFSYIKFAIGFNLPLIPHYFSEYILNQSDRIMIQKLTNYENVALYSVAYSTGMVMTLVSSSLNQAITPWLYKTLDKKEFEKIKKTLLPIGLLLMVPIVLFIAFAPEVIYVMAGPQYAEARYVIPPVAGSILFLFFYTNFANIEFYYDYNKFTMYISLIGAAINIILNFMFINMFGYIAAAYTTFASFFIYFIGHYLFMSYIVKKKENVKIFELREMLGLSFALLVMMIIMSLLYSNIILRYSVIAIIIIAAIIKRKAIIHLIKDVKM